MSNFYKQLDVYAETENTEVRDGITAALWQEFGTEQAVFILDLSGFSKTAGKHGIVHCLSMIQRMRTVLEPLVDQYGGHVVKFEADNCFARFPEPLSAIWAAIDCNRTLADLNSTAHENFIILASIGIDFGKFLLVNDHDYFGVPVNIASKLGEDTAKPGQILVTDEVMMQLGPDTDIRSQPLTVQISGLNISSHEILYSAG